MTNEEAIKILSSLKPSISYGGCDDCETFNLMVIEALNMAIEALEKEEIQISTLDIKKNDTILIDIDPDITDICFASGYAKKLQDVFPTNNILVKVKGIDIDVKKLEAEAIENIPEDFRISPE